MDKKQVKPSLKFSIIINKERWTINLFTGGKFDTLWPDAIGITHYDHKSGHRSISFKSDAITRDTVAHELFHAYLAHKDYSKVSYAAIEESICEVIGKKHKVLARLTDRIFKKLTRK